MYFEVDGARTFAAGRITGATDAPVVVLVHGAAMDHSIWVYHTRYFMHAGRDVVAVDLPAHGLSDGAPLATIEDMAAWLERCLDALGISRAAVAGHSMGALAALELAGRAGIGSSGWRCSAAPCRWRSRRRCSNKPPPTAPWPAT